MELTALFSALLLPLLLLLCANVLIGVAAMGMAKKRGLMPVPAFFAGLFGSFVALLFIAVIPVKMQGGTEAGK